MRKFHASNTLHSVRKKERKINLDSHLSSAQIVRMTKNIATLEADLETFNTWSDSNPMKATCIAFTVEDIARLHRAIESEARKQATIAKHAAFNALPWFKKLFRSV
jgi:hypothetical protein